MMHMQGEMGITLKAVFCELHRAMADKGQRTTGHNARCVRGYLIPFGFLPSVTWPMGDQVTACAKLLKC
jgi:hypothetical protein